MIREAALSRWVRLQVLRIFGRVGESDREGKTAMKARTPRKRTRRDSIHRMKPGDELIVKCSKARRRVRVQADEGVTVEHVRGGSVRI